MSPSTTPELSPSLKEAGRAGGGSGWFVRLVLLAVLSLPILGLVGCGGGETAEKDVLLATVGDKEIKGSYYENRLALLAKEELPRDDQGEFLDMASEAGKQQFLETLINKEVMAVTAVNLGYDSDPQIATSRENLLAYEAAAAMKSAEITEPANTISEEQLNAFYAKMGSSRKCRYVITNFLEKAMEAREFALTGADWDDVVIQYHDGDESPDGQYVIDVPYGRYKTSYEDAVFNAEIGGITEPIKTAYGFWVLKVDSDKPGNPPPLEEAKAQILDITRGRQIARLRDEFKEGIREEYKFFLNETALWKCYEGLPRKEELFYPGTKDAVRKDDLLPLDISTVDRELPYYGYTTPEGIERVYTLGDYKSHFDKMGVFQRPKRSQMLGNLREKIIGELDRTLINFASKDRGYYEDEAALLKVNKMVEEMLVSKLFSELVVIDERITSEQLDEFWAEHEQDYFVPETRGGSLIVCADRTTADAAYAAAKDGMDWAKVFKKYSADQGASGKVEKVRSDSRRPIRDALFTVATGEISPVFDAGGGKFGIVKLETINEPYQNELKDVRQAVGDRMKQIREEETFQNLLAQWKADLEIVTYPENLAGLKSWEELVIGPPPENLVPRN